MSVSTNNFSNWSGLVASRPAEVRAVSCVGDVQMAIRDAIANGWTIRTAGSAHSHSELLHNDEGMVLLTDALAGNPVVNAGAGTTRIAAGTKLKAIGEPLWTNGFSLVNQGDIDVQSIGGLIGTGVHGTGRALKSISDSVAGVTLATGEGDLVSTDEDPAFLEAARLNLGALGVIVDVTLNLVPAYYLHERTWVESVLPVMERIDQLTAATRHFEFFWHPRTDQAHAKALHPHPGPADTMNDRKNESVDRAYVVFPTVRGNKHTEMEYSVPAEEGPACFMRIRELMHTRFPEVEWPTEYRTVAADQGWISPARGRSTVTISIHQGIDKPYEAFFRESESIIREHRGRPHWGKVHHMSARELAPEHPDTWDQFWAVQRTLDPNGRFLNQHLRRMVDG